MTPTEVVSPLVPTCLRCCLNPQGMQCSTERWQIAGRHSGPMYRLSPGRVFASKASVAFAGVHSMQSQVYVVLGEPSCSDLDRSGSTGRDGDPVHRG